MDILLTGKQGFDTTPTTDKQLGYPKCFDLAKANQINAEIPWKAIGYQHQFPEESSDTIKKSGFNLNTPGGPILWLGHTDFIIESHGGIPFWQWSREKCRQVAAARIPNVQYILFDIEWEPNRDGYFYDNTTYALEQAQRYAWIFEYCVERNPNVICEDWFAEIGFKIASQGTQRGLGLTGWNTIERDAQGNLLTYRSQYDAYLEIHKQGMSFTPNAVIAKYNEHATAISVGWGYNDSMYASYGSGENLNQNNRSSFNLFLSRLDQNLRAAKVFPGKRRVALAWPREEPGIEYAKESAVGPKTFKVNMTTPQVGSFTIQDKVPYDPCGWGDTTLLSLFDVDAIYFWDGKPPVSSERRHLWNDTKQCKGDVEWALTTWSGGAFSCPSPERWYMRSDATFVDEASSAIWKFKQLDEDGSFIPSSFQLGIACEYVRDVPANIAPANVDEAAVIWNSLSNKKILPSYSLGEWYNRSAALSQPVAVVHTKPLRPKKVVKFIDPFCSPGKRTWFRFDMSGNTYYVVTNGHRAFVDTFNV